MAKKTEAKERLMKELPEFTRAIDQTGILRCTRPCYIFRHHKEEKTGSMTDPYRWELDLCGYPIVNIVVAIRGAAGKSYGVQVRHHHPSASIGPTTTFVVDSDSGQLGPAGFQLVTFSGLRPLMPVLDVIVFSNDNEPFDSIITTVYATVA
jgi:hypothetical protein